VRASAGAGVVLGLALRLPWFDAPLGRDEAGVSMVARAWHHSHPFPYGPYFLDRPPLLVLAYRLANDAGGATGVRVLGMIAASLVVVVCTLLAAHVAGRRAALPAALLAAAFASSALLDSVFTPAELLAAVPSTASVLFLLSGLGKDSGWGWRLAAAGAAGTVAVLVKQSFGDALVAGAVGVLVAAWGVPWRRTVGHAAAFATGAACVVLGVLVWEQVAHTAHRSPDSVSYALTGFRIDAVHTLTHGDVSRKLAALGSAALGSGMALAALVAIAGLVTLRRRRVTAGALTAWLLAGLVGVIGGGSYWSHYLIELVPVSVVGVAALVAWRPRVGAVLCAAALAIGVTTSIDHVALGRPAEFQRAAVVLGRYVHDRSLPGDTAYVLYAKVNVLFYTGLPSPFPYHWSLMMVAVPRAEQQLRALLASPRRPTWIVEAQFPRAFGLDRSGETARLLARNYHRVARVCGRPVLLARRAGSRPQAALEEPCRALPAEGFDLDF
jgi:4-amino-4-deoxy-L-arabinose transferase-like glycosyltransferase